MDLDQLHYEILRLKLRKAEVILEKNEAIKCERYEKAADLREKERKINDDLALIQAKLMHYDASLMLSANNLTNKQKIHNLLIELNPFDRDFMASCMERTELRIAELKLQRQAHLSNKANNSAESVILELNEQMKLRSEIHRHVQNQ